MSKQVRIFLLKDVAKIGRAGEIIKAADGFAYNFLLARKLGVEVTPQNEKRYQEKAVSSEGRSEATSAQTSLRAERIKALKLTLKRKTHDNGKLYASVSPLEVVDLLAEKGERISKSQIAFEGDKMIKSVGTYEVIIKLSSKLQPTVKLSVISE